MTVQVPSALAGLTAGFEKGPGVPPPLQTPRNQFSLPLAEFYKLVNALYQMNSERNSTLVAGRTVPPQQQEEEKPSTISTGKLSASQHVHCPPFKQVVFLRSYLVLQ